MAENMQVNTAPEEEILTGSAEDVEAIMKKYDRESNTRIWEGTPKVIIGYLLAAFAVLMVYMNLFGPTATASLIPHISKFPRNKESPNWLPPLRFC